MSQTVKKSSLIFNLLRAAFVVLAYKHVITPKSSMITAGTGRATAHYLKSCLSISRAYISSLAQRIRYTLPYRTPDRYADFGPDTGGEK